MKKNKDVGFIDDSIFTLTNLIAAQNHAQNSFSMTKDVQWIEIAKLVREIRSKLLYKMVKEEDSEIYCFSKHILASACGLKELGDRMTASGDVKYAKELYEDSANCEKLFKLLNEKQ